MPMRDLPETWTHFPVRRDDTRVADWYVVAELYAALMERRQFFGGRFPRHSQPFGGDRGGYRVVSATFATDPVTGADDWLTAVTVERDARIGVKPVLDPATNPPPMDWAPDWVLSYTFDGDFIPLDAVIEPATVPLDPRLVVRTLPTGNTTGTLTLVPVCTYGASPVGGQLTFLRRKALPSFGSHWPDRWPSVPNDAADWEGDIAGHTSTTVTVTGAGWAANQWAGRRLYYEGTVEVEGVTCSRTYEVEVVGNTADTITVTPALAPAMSTRVAVGPPGLYWRVGGQGEAWWKWYRTDYTDALLGVNPDWSPGAADKPSLNVIWNTITGPRTVQVFDRDLWVPIDLDGDTLAMPRDKSYSHDLYKAVRGLQTYVEETCGTYVPMIELAGRKHIPTFTFPTLCKKADIGVWGEVVVGDDGTASLPDVPGAEVLHWALTHDGWAPTGNAGTAAPGETLSFAPKVRDEDDCRDGDPGDAGRVVVWAAGWPREIDREVRYVYPATFFQPETPSDPRDPSEGEPGLWLPRTGLGQSQVYDEFGMPRPGPTLEAGEVYRYAGYRGGEDVDGIPASAADAEWAVKRVDVYARDDMLAAMGGTAAAGGPGWLDSGQSAWWWWGVQYTHLPGAGALAVTGTSLTDPSKVGSPLWSPSTGRLAGFVLEIEQPGVDGGPAGPCHGVRRVIAASDASTGTVTFADVPLLSATYDSGADGATACPTAYRIREPRYRLNWWRWSTLVLTDGDGVQRRVTVTHNDDGCLWFTPAVAPAAGWRWRLERFEPGDVLRRTSDGGGAWEYADEDHPRSAEPGKLARYGRARKWDLLTPELYNSLYRAVRECQWVTHPATWRNTATREPATVTVTGSGADGPHGGGPWEWLRDWYLYARGKGGDGTYGFNESGSVGLPFDDPPASIDTSLFEAVADVRDVAADGDIATWRYEWPGTGDYALCRQPSPYAGGARPQGSRYVNLSWWVVRSYYFNPDDPADDRLYLGGPWYAPGVLQTQYGGGAGVDMVTSHVWSDGIPNGTISRKIPCVCEWYVRTERVRPRRCPFFDPGLACEYTYDVSASFNPFGSPLLHDAWALVGSAGGTDEDRVGPKVGSCSLPDWPGVLSCSWPGIPTLPEPGQQTGKMTIKSRYEGFRVKGELAVVKPSLSFG